MAVSTRLIALLAMTLYGRNMSCIFQILREKHTIVSNSEILLASSDGGYIPQKYQMHLWRASKSRKTTVSYAKHGSGRYHIH